MLFWNVDTQVDFVEPSGKLYVEAAEKMKPIWKEITAFAKQKNIKVVSTADFHHANSAELSESPDFINTFPEHCMANTKGAEYIDETNPEDPLIFEWDKNYQIAGEMLKTKRNVVIRKDAFDVFAGNPNSEKILETINPEIVVVYGVTTNVCVHFAVTGLAKKVEKVYVVKDAIKELPNIPLPFETWNKEKVSLINFEVLKRELN